MGARACFGRLHGSDLVQQAKGSPEYYARIFADAGVAPEDAVVVDDQLSAIRWAVAAGARGVLVGFPGQDGTEAVLSIDGLAGLPRLIERLVPDQERSLG